MDGKNIQPGDVVGNNQASRRGVCRLGIKPNGKNFQYLVRPVLLQSRPPFVVDQRVDDGRTEANPHEVQCQPQAAENSDQLGVEWANLINSAV